MFNDDDDMKRNSYSWLQKFLFIKILVSKFLDTANYQQLSTTFWYICLAMAKKKKGNKGKAKSKSAFDKELTNTSQKALKKLRTGLYSFTHDLNLTEIELCYCIVKAWPLWSWMFKLYRMSYEERKNAGMFKKKPQGNKFKSKQRFVPTQHFIDSIYVD